MNIRTKFLILIGSIITIPVVVAALVGYIYMTYDVRNEQVPPFPGMNRIMKKELPRLYASGRMEEIFQRIPKQITVVYMGEGRKVLLSNSPFFPSGASLSSDDFFSAVREHYHDDSIIIEPFDLSPSESGHLVWISNFFQDPPPRQPNYYIVFMFVILIIGAFFSAAFIGSFRRSLFNLEEATRRLSSGDLDFELAAHGNDELASLTRSFEMMRRSIKEESEKRSRFLMAVSHDLSTPLTSIRGYIEAIEDGLAEEPKDLKKYLDIMMDKSLVLESRIAKLIEFVRMGTGEWKSTHELVVLKDFLFGVCKAYKEDAIILKRNFSFSIDIPGDISLYLDKSLLARALENLFSNAARYTKEGDSIELKAACVGDRIDVTLKDTGAGIPPEDLKMLFDPFWHGKRFTKQEGFGLGLSIVKTIIDAHGWSIEVSSELDKETSFTIHIPYSAREG